MTILCTPGLRLHATMMAFAYSTLDSLTCFGWVFTPAVSSDSIISSRLIVQKTAFGSITFTNEDRAGLRLLFEIHLRGFTSFGKGDFLIRLLSSVFLGVELMPLLLDLSASYVHTITAGSIVARWFGAFITILHSARVTAGYDMDALITIIRHVDRRTRRGCIVLLHLRH